MTYHRPTQAFTLIELMISIALGTLILYTAFAGFRTASQAITIANSLSLENSLLRAGYFRCRMISISGPPSMTPTTPPIRSCAAPLRLDGGPLQPRTP
jgi:prepilin-type N-terminal cleavage/methylation domain-containing protein